MSTPNEEAIAETKEIIAIPVWVKDLATAWESDLLAWQNKKLTQHQKGWKGAREQSLRELRWEMERVAK